MLLPVCVWRQYSLLTAGRNRICAGRLGPAGADSGFPLRLPVLDSSASGMWDLVKEFWEFLRKEKKWWLWPLVGVLLVLAALLIFASGSGLAWALYPFM